MAVRVLLADDHAILREGLRHLLDERSDMEVVGEASDGAGAISLSRRLKPDIIVMDVNMPGMDGIDATRQIVRELPEVKVVALSMYPKSTFVVEMLKAGASAYVLKEQAFKELIKAIDTVMTGEVYLSTKAASVMVDKHIRGRQPVGKVQGTALATRERNVLKLLAEGKSSKEIAKIINMSVQTVDACRRSLMSKLHARSIADLVKYAIREGLTKLDV